MDWVMFTFAFLGGFCGGCVATVCIYVVMTTSRNVSEVRAERLRERSEG